MFLVNHSTRENAEGKIKETFNRIPKSLEIPTPLLVASASPELFERHACIMDYFAAHKTLEPHVLAAIRYVVSSLKGFPACIDFNFKLLKAIGMKPEEIEALNNTPIDSPFEKRELMLLEFVKQSVVNPAEIGSENLDDLKAEGWTESDLIDAVYHGSGMFIAGGLAGSFTE